MVTRESFTTWLDAYGAGWMSQNPDATLALFTDDATYMYTPFHKIMKGKDQIRRYVEKGVGDLQEDIQFDYKILAVTSDYGINRWYASLTWKETRQRLHFDGIYQVFLNEENLCTQFNEWWHAQPPLPEANAPD